MEKQVIQESVIGIIADCIKLDKCQISLDMSVGDIPQWGSMAQMSILATVQSDFEVEIPEEDLFDLTSVSDIVEEVAKLKGI